MEKKKKETSHLTLNTPLHLNYDSMFPRLQTCLTERRGGLGKASTEKEENAPHSMPVSQGRWKRGGGMGHIHAQQFGAQL